MLLRHTSLPKLILMSSTDMLFTLSAPANLIWAALTILTSLARPQKKPNTSTLRRPYSKTLYTYNPTATSFCDSRWIMPAYGSCIATSSGTRLWAWVLCWRLATSPSRCSRKPAKRASHKRTGAGQGWARSLRHCNGAIVCWEHVLRIPC